MKQKLLLIVVPSYKNNCIFYITANLLRYPFCWERIFLLSWKRGKNVPTFLCKSFEWKRLFFFSWCWSSFFVQLLVQLREIQMCMRTVRSKSLRICRVHINITFNKNSIKFLCGFIYFVNMILNIKKYIIGRKIAFLVTSWLRAWVHWVYLVLIKRKLN